MSPDERHFRRIYRQVYGEPENTDRIAAEIVTQMIADGMFDYSKDRAGEIQRVETDLSMRLAYVAQHPLAAYDVTRRVRQRKN
jgi:hypothetical protein